MRFFIVVFIGILPCLIFGQTQEVPSPEDLGKTIDSSISTAEPVKKIETKKKVIKKKRTKKKKSKKKIKNKKTDNNKTTGAVK